jgi:hypothetical protein
MPPQVGLLWTPGYWGWGGGAFLFHAGYWGPHVGFYGGVHYGGGYTGEGFEGGRWEHDHFRYNTAVNNINTTIIHNTYNQTVINNITVNKVSYNGGAGGIAAAPSHQDQLAARERHAPPPMLQRRHIDEAGRNPELQARFNQGRPPIAATPRPAAFTAPNIVRARGAVPSGAAPGAEAAYRPALQPHPGNREPTPYRDATPAQSPQAMTTRAPTDAPQQPPRLRPEFAQPQQRQPQAPSAVYQQRPQPEAPSAQYQQRPQPQAPAAQYQQRPQPQAPAAQYQQRPQPQAPAAQFQQRPQPQAPAAPPQQRPQPQAPPAQPQQRPQPQAPRQPAPPDGRHEGNRDNGTR